MPRMRKLLLLTAITLAVSVYADDAKTMRIDQFDLRQVAQGWGTPQKNKSVDKNPLTIGGKTFEHGFGTHAHSKMTLDLDGAGGTFKAFVGVDDETKGQGTVQFKVIGDKKTLFDSGIMKGNDAAKEVNVSLDGIKRLSLIVDDGGDGETFDHADWGDAVFSFNGEAPKLHVVVAEPYILTPAAPKTPRINGAKVFGVRPGHPFLFTIAATGDRPMTFSADNLPDGLSLDSSTGQITGKITSEGDHAVTLHAEKFARRGQSRIAQSSAARRSALTPPMGWNSWNCWASSVSDEKVRAAADAMEKAGLIEHGWTYINIDDYWEFKPAAKDDPTLQGNARDKDGFINPNKRFPDMKALTDYVHAKGLKIGLYSSPGPLTCGGCIASYQHEDQDAQVLGRMGIRLHQIRLVQLRPDRRENADARSDESSPTS